MLCPPTPWTIAVPRKLPISEVGLQSASCFGHPDPTAVCRSTDHQGRPWWSCLDLPRPGRSAQRGNKPKGGQGKCGGSLGLAAVPSYDPRSYGFRDARSQPAKQVEQVAHVVGCGPTILPGPTRWGCVCQPPSVAAMAFRAAMAAVPLLRSQGSRCRTRVSQLPNELHM